MPRVLIVDDEADIRDTVDMILRYEKFETDVAKNGDEALSLLDSRDPDVVLLDVKMPGKDGLEVLGEMKRAHPEIEVVMVSGHATIQTAVEATKLGAIDFLEKPLDRDRLLLTLRNVTRTNALARENTALRSRISERYRLIGESPAMRDILAAVDKIAPTQARILVTGENGTGKELVARNIHERSPRWRGPFVEVNCAAIPENLIESELFGHEKGSFTGAMQRRKGKFEQADAGTLFLDEIGDMDLAAQAKVLRVLEESIVQRVGGDEAIPVDVRVIAATNKDLEECVGDGRFREDLFYRLNVVPIHLPPLTARKEDIPLLARHFLSESVRANGLQKRRLTSEAEARLCSLPWPGNVRQLRNAMERLSILETEDEIGSEAVERHLASHDGRSGDPFTECSSFEEFKYESEKMFFESRLLENDWNVKRTAERLGMQRSHLYKKIEKYGLK